MRRYGALRSFMPVTFATFGLCYLAIIGVPPFAGYWSKDAIIEAALASGGTRGWVLGAITILGAGITAFYMTRVMLMTFGGERRWAADESEVTEDRALQHPHESPRVMTWPMIVLAIGAVFSGGVLAIGGRLEHWLEPVVAPVLVGHEAAHPIPAWLTGAVTLGTVVLGVAVAYRMYSRKPIPITAPADVSPLTVAAREYLYGDAFNEEVFMRPGNRLAQVLVDVDDRVVDGSVNTGAGLVAIASILVRRLQTGFVRSYALTMLAGTVLVVAVVLAVQL
jgi:NADH-quinone oxidoreductase subunit L